jgi:hypothetical protein
MIDCNEQVVAADLASHRAASLASPIGTVGAPSCGLLNAYEE